MGNCQRKYKRYKDLKQQDTKETNNLVKNWVQIKTEFSAEESQMTENLLKKS